MTSQERNDILFITDAVRRIFGINSPIYLPYGEGQALEFAGYHGIRMLPQETDESGDDTLSEFGLPVLAPIIFQEGDYNVYDRRTGELSLKRMDNYTLPFSTIADFSASKNIVTTALLGGAGTVKEIYGFPDWKITLRGIAVSSRNGSGPSAQEQIDTLARWCEIAGSIPVQSSIFRRKNIYNIVIERFDIKPVVARWNAVPFQIDAVSDLPVELYEMK